jgi:hypothetical protein
MVTLGALERRPSRIVHTRVESHPAHGGLPPQCASIQ